MRVRMRRPILYLIVTMLGLLVLLTGACSGGNDTVPPDGEVEIRNAPIHEVDVRIAESYPPQVFIYIKGGLSDGCTTFHELKTERSGSTINIEVTTQRPKEAICTEIYGFFEKNVNLGTDFTSGETYTINVNDYTTSFTMQ